MKQIHNNRTIVYTVVGGEKNSKNLCILSRFIVFRHLLVRLIHSAVDHSKHFIGPVSGPNTQEIEAVWTRLRFMMVKQMKLAPLIDSHLFLSCRLKYKQNPFKTFFLDVIR